MADALALQVSARSDLNIARKYGLWHMKSGKFFLTNPLVTSVSTSARFQILSKLAEFTLGGYVIF